MDVLTLLSDMTQVQEREALHLHVQFPNEKVAREVSFVGECARSDIGLEIATGPFSSHECAVCGRPVSTHP